MPADGSSKQEQGDEKGDAIGLGVVLHCKILRADGTVREEFDAHGVINTGGMNDHQ